MEFNRIVGKNLKLEFFESIDRHTLRLVEIFRSKRGNVGQLLTQLLQQTRVCLYPLYMCIGFLWFNKLKHVRISDSVLVV